MQVHREHDEILKRGAMLVFIGMGSRFFAAAFREQFDLEAPLYVAANLDAYRALGMRSGFRDIFNRASLRNVPRAWRAGFRPGLIQGDGRQLGGVVVVRPGGEVVYAYRSAAGGDHPPVAGILREL